MEQQKEEININKQVNRNAKGEIIVDQHKPATEPQKETCSTTGDHGNKEANSSSCSTTPLKDASAKKEETEKTA